jgi:predicted nucleic acid-binding protein
VGNKVFLDTAYAIALASPNDSFHSCAVRLADHFESAQTRLVTTYAILLEIGNALAKRRFRNAAIRLIDSIESDPNIEVIPLSEAFYTKALRLFRDRSDKDWGMTDCISFIVMKEHGITEALTTDEHFSQAGFRVLMRE